MGLMTLLQRSIGTSGAGEVYEQTVSLDLPIVEPGQEDQVVLPQQLHTSRPKLRNDGWLEIELVWTKGGKRSLGKSASLLKDRVRPTKEGFKSKINSMGDIGNSHELQVTKGGGVDRPPLRASVGTTGGDCWFGPACRATRAARPGCTAAAAAAHFTSKEREDGWLEIELGQFFNRGGEDDELQFGLKEDRDHANKGIEGFESKFNSMGEIGNAHELQVTKFLTSYYVDY
ncbi:f-box protein pp2-b13 [Quercus suber]|uniref:F-box protein pp2-b13 n=1 Tax=Quercus suber TaxID=58331 RepID=A0AAW0KQD4_QUESU